MFAVFLHIFLVIPQRFNCSRHCHLPLEVILLPHIFDIPLDPAQILFGGSYPRICDKIVLQSPHPKRNQVKEQERIVLSLSYSSYPTFKKTKVNINQIKLKKNTQPPKVKRVSINAPNKLNGKVKRATMFPQKPKTRPKSRMSYRV